MGSPESPIQNKSPPIPLLFFSNFYSEIQIKKGGLNVKTKKEKS
jgi:hypothetical protein